MTDHQRPSSETKRISANYWTVRGICELESTHGIQPDDPNPVRDERVFPALRCQYSAIGMRDDAGAEASEDGGPEMMVWMVMRQHDPFYRLLCDRADPAQEVLSLTGTRQRIDDDDA